MVNYYFSKTTCSFYPAEPLDMYEEAGTLPDDIVSVTDEVYQTYTASPPEGKTRGAGSKGQPAWVDIPAPDKESAIILATLKKKQLMNDAEEKITLLSRAEKYDVITTDERVQLEVLKKYTVSLSRVNPEDAPEISWPEVPSVA